jgi:hypothetical protein
LGVDLEMVPDLEPHDPGVGLNGRPGIGDRLMATKKKAAKKTAKKKVVKKKK